jgi:hypothetical protein
MDGNWENFPVIYMITSPLKKLKGTRTTLKFKKLKATWPGMTLIFNNFYHRGS